MSHPCEQPVPDAATLEAAAALVVKYQGKGEQSQIQARDAADILRLTARRVRNQAAVERNP